MRHYVDNVPLYFNTNHHSALNSRIENSVIKEIPTQVFFRSNHRRCSIKTDVLKNCTKFTGKHLCQGLFFNKVAGLRPVTLLKRRLWHRCFPVNFAKFLRTHFLQNIHLDECFCVFLYILQNV